MTLYNKMVKTYNDFLQFIDEGQARGYRVCFESSTIEMERWTAGRYLEYLGELERYKNETGISLQYEFLGDDNRINGVDVFIHYPEGKDIPERNHKMHWIVKFVRKPAPSTNVCRHLCLEPDSGTARGSINSATGLLSDRSAALDTEAIITKG